MIRPAVSKRAVVRLVKQIPFDVPDGWEYESSVMDVCVALGKCLNLEVLRLVLPRWCDTEVVDQGVMKDFAGRIERLREVVGEGLKVELVKLSRVKTAIGDLITADEKQERFVKGLTEKGWKVRTAKCDKFGRYDVGDM